MHNTIQYTQLVFDSYPFSSLYKILSKSLDVYNNNHTEAPPLHNSLIKPKRAQMRKPFKERQQFWCLFFFFLLVFRQPITNLVNPGSKFRSSSAALFAFLSAAIIFRVGTPTDTTSSRTGLAAHKRWKRGERATRDDRAGRRGVHRMARSHFSCFLLGCPLPNQWQPGVKSNLTNDAPVPNLVISDQSDTRECAHFVISGESEVRARGILVISVEWEVDSSWSSKSDLTGAGTFRSDQLTAAVGF